MSDRRGRGSSQDDRSAKRTPSRAPSRRREASRDRSGTTRTSSSNSGSYDPLGSDNGKNPRYYPPAAGGRSGGSASSQQPLLSTRSSASTSVHSSAPSVDLPVYVRYSDASSKDRLLPSDYGSSTRSDRTSSTRPQPEPKATSTLSSRHEPPPSRPSSSNPVEPLTSSGGSGHYYSDPTAPVVSHPGAPSWAQASTPQRGTTVSKYPDHGHSPAPQTTSLPPPGRAGAPTYAPSYTDQYSYEPDSYDSSPGFGGLSGGSGHASGGRPAFSARLSRSGAASGYYNDYSSSYTGSRDKGYTHWAQDAGLAPLPSEANHPGEIVVGSRSNLSQALSRPDNDSNRYRRTASPYTQAAGVEAKESRKRSEEGGWPVKGGSNPSIRQDYTQASHERLARVAGRSADEWRGRDLEKERKNNERRDTHDRYTKQMENDRKGDNERRGGGRA